MPATPGSGGRSPQTYIALLRQMLRDYPVQDDQQLSGDGSRVKFILAGCPMNDDLYFTLAVGGAAQVVTTDRTTVAGKVFVDYQTGLLIFGTAPAAGTNNIQIGRARVAYRDSELMEVLQGALSPMRGKTFGRFIDTSITMQVLKYDYTLPAIFNDSHAHIEKVEIQEIPIGINPYRVIRGWRRAGDTTLVVPSSQYYSPGATLRIQYRAPYRSLGELTESLVDLPLWWAMATLLSSDQRRRLRVDTPPVAADQGSNPWMAPMQTASYYRKLFWEHLDAVQRMPRKAGTTNAYAVP